ncbi:MAG: Ldh family oxidoreductase [Chloroflexi bacterium]|nr:Ldh family oxidoreductase [Chloroflexota bacterium]
MPPDPKDRSVPIDRLLAFAEGLLQAVGVPQEDARLTSHILLQADLRGVESHGMAHLVDFYVRALQSGRTKPRPNISVTRESAAAATIDGDGGLGFVVGHHAMGLAIEKARETGVGIVSVGNSTHYGAGAFYGMMALEHDMIGISMTTGGRLMAPPGSRGQAVGTNVLSLAAPTPRSFPYVLDMATTVVAAGKLEIAARRGRPIPEGWAVDGAGRPLTDPAMLHSGAALLPLGGATDTGAYKGFGLALMVDILCGALSGFGTSAEIETGTAAHCFGALRIEAFQPIPQYLERMEGMIAAVKRASKEEGIDEIHIAGELEHTLADERREAGAVPLHPAILEGYRVAAEEFGVPFDLTEAS